MYLCNFPCKYVANVCVFACIYVLFIVRFLHIVTHCMQDLTAWSHTTYIIADHFNLTQCVASYNLNLYVL